MIHSMILLMVLALSLGLGSVAVSWRYLSLYKLDFIKYLIIFLIALNTAAVAGIFYNYYVENLKDVFSRDVYWLVNTGYRLVANFILFVVGGSLVVMLHSLVDHRVSRNYLGLLTAIWGLVFVVFIAGIWYSPANSPIPLINLANIALDQMVQYLVLFECIRAWTRTSRLTEPVRRKWTRYFLTLFAAIWIGLIIMSFLMFTDESGNRLFNLLSAFVYVILNGVPLAFLGLFLRRVYGSPTADGAGSAYSIRALCDRHGISPRERDVLRLLCKGYPNKKIADELCIALSTVKDHNHNIFRKLDVTNRTQLVARLNNTGL